MPDLSQIPGGADTQVANTSGNPEAVGLSPQQVGQAEDAYMRSIARGPDQLRHQQDLAEQPSIEIGQTGDVGFIPEEGAPQGQQPPEEQLPEDYEEVDVQLPSGEIATVAMPKGTDAETIRWHLIDQGVEGFTPDGSVVERAMYGFRQENNITENIGNWAKSHFPYLAGEYRVDGDGVSFVDATEKYGEDFLDLTPQQRRDRIDEVDAKLLQEDMPNVHPKNLGIAGTVGAVGSAIADPVALVPGGAAMKGVATVGKGMRVGATTGAAWGGAYELSDVAATQGLPTSLGEIAQAAPKIGTGMVVGGVGGAALGGAVGGVTGRWRSRAHRKIVDPDKVLKFTRKRYWPEFWKLQEEGYSTGQAGSMLRKKWNLSLDDEWRMRASLVDIEDDIRRKVGSKAKKKNIVREETLSERQGTAIYSPGENAWDAARRRGEARTANWGDPILHGSFQKGVDNLFRPIAGVVRDISPRIYKRLTDMEGAILRKTHEYHLQFKPFMREAKKLYKIASEVDQKRFARALFNNDPATGERIWMKYGLSRESYAGMRQGIARLEQELLDAGVKLETIEGYFPRIMADFDGFRRATGRNPKLQGLEAAVKAARQKKGRDLTDSEMNSVVNAYMEPASYRKRVKKTVGSEKKRSVKEVTDDLVKFYHDPITSLEFHLREAVSKAERARFFGKAFKTKEGVDDISASVGEMVKNDGIDAANIDRLKEVLEARFGMGEQSGSKGWSSLRSGVGGLTLGNPISAIRQLGDLPSVMRTQGAVNTLISMFKKADPNLDADAFGYMSEMAQELDTKGAASAVRALSQGAYKYLGFRTIDRFSKNTLIKAAIRNTLKSSKTPQGRRKLIDKYGDIYDKGELAQLMIDAEEAAKGEAFTDLLKSHINAEVMRIQPISRSQMPLKYLQMPNGRLFWQFRTWGLNQIELFRQDIWRGLRHGSASEKARAASAAVAWMVGLGATNIGITQAQRILTRREPLNNDEISDEFVWQALGNFAIFDRYAIEKAAESGEAEDFLKSWIPPSLSIPGTIMLKIGQVLTGEKPVDQETLKGIAKESGGLGRILYYLGLGGAEDYNAKLQKKRTSEMFKTPYSQSNPYAQ